MRSGGRDRVGRVPRLRSAWSQQLATVRLATPRSSRSGGFGTPNFSKSQTFYPYGRISARPAVSIRCNRHKALQTAVLKEFSHVVRPACPRLVAPRTASAGRPRERARPARPRAPFGNFQASTRSPGSATIRCAKRPADGGNRTPSVRNAPLPARSCAARRIGRRTREKPETDRCSIPNRLVPTASRRPAGASNRTRFLMDFDRRPRRSRSI